MPSALETILAAAESAVGVNYVWGGNSLASGVDCSGLIQQAYAAAGIQIPRVSNQQAKFGSQVTWEDMRPGDLIWIDNSSRNNGADHIAIYMGNGLMVEAPRRGKQVQVVPIPPQQARRVPMGVTRVVQDLSTEATPNAAVRLGPNAGREFTQAALNISARDGVSAFVEGGGQPGTAAATTAFDSSGVPTPTAPQSVVVEGAPEGGLGDGLAEDATEEETLAYIRKALPQFAQWLANDEVRYVLTWGVREKKDTAEVQAALRKTNYWQTHGPESRAFDTLLANDKASADALINKTRILVDQEYQKQGIKKTRDELDKVTLGYIRGGWDINDLTRSIANEMGKSLEGGRGLDAGDASADADTFIAWARDMGLPLDRATAEKWALEVAGGKQTADGVKSRLSNLARGRWQYDPEVLEYITGGGTAADYFAIHRNIIGETLELAPDSIDLFSDPKYADITQMYDKDAKVKRSMTTGEVAQWARNQPGYAGTRRYKQQDASFTDALLRTFGEVA